MITLELSVAQQTMEEITILQGPWSLITTRTRIAAAVWLYGERYWYLGYPIASSGALISSDNSKQEMQEPIPDESKTTKDSDPLRDTICVNYPTK